ncbi:MAG: hypothetical protein A3G26_00390 [Betaproteobacteria bacterium RIFCSPLOWO2_12_FULL_65_110]|nr:MAG: hypothetical protein A3G26_00390 [Betaproteobacteria bacterium RIFCSPLOWO2_12_FULL_65_110]
MLALGATAARAQDWPSRPVTVVFPYGAGAGDTIMRLVADGLGRRLGQTFVVENRPGAGGIIGSSAVAKAAPDGYSLIVSGVGSLIVAPFFNPAPFDPINSFTHIALFGGPPVALLVSPSGDARSVNEFIALTKAKPGGIGYGTPGRGTHAHLIGEMFGKLSGAKIFNVPYNSGTAPLSDIAGAHIQAAFVSLGAAATFIRSGKVRLLAITTARRSAEFPDVPTFAEEGYGDLVATTWFGLSGPARLPRSIVDRLNTEVRAVLALPDVREKLNVLGIETRDLDADAYTAFILEELNRWGTVARGLK